MSDYSMGDDMGDDVLGDDMMGDDVLGYDASGAAPPWARAWPRRGARPGRPQSRRPQMARPQMRPQWSRPPLGAPLMQAGQRLPWRQTQLAPGVLAPFEGVYILPLQPSVNGGVFTNAVGTIQYSAQPQKPFRGRRLVVTINRSAGANGVAVQGQQLTVGIDPQQVQAGAFSLDVFAPTAFQVDLALAPAQPGILITLPVFTTPVVPVGESIVVTAQILGEVIT